MHCRLLSLCLLCFGQILWATTPIEIVDHTGTMIRLQQPAQRIISLAPNLTEILFAIDAAQQVKGVSISSDYPALAKELPQVGGYRTINIEQILVLNADLVLVWQNGNPAGQIAQLKQLGIPVFQARLDTITDLFQLIQHIGLLSGHVTSANKLVTQLTHQFAQLKSQAQTLTHHPAVFMQLSQMPLFALGQHSIQAQLIELCGGRNAFSQIQQPSAHVSIESVIATQPDIIFTMTPESPNYWQKWTDIPAVRHHQLKQLPADYVSRAGPRLIKGAALICQAIQTAVDNRHTPPASIDPAE